MTVQTLEKQISPIKPSIDPNLMHLLMLAPPQPIHNRRTYQAYIRILELCLEALETGESAKSFLHALNEYIKIISPLIAEYEKQEYPAPKTTQGEVLRFLMEQNNLTQDELAEDMGGQSAVSYVLSDKRTLNVKQIEKLSKKFHVTPSVFFTV